jgi:hypothetical protein
MARQLKGFFILSIAFIFLTMTSQLAGADQAGLLEYEVVSIDAAGWVVTAREMESGETVKFRLPPALFHGKTFDADLDSLQIGDLFSVQGPKNVHMNNVPVEQPLPETSQGRRPSKGLAAGAEGGVLSWEILNVNPRQWTATAKNRLTHKIIKFRVLPEAFVGLRFQAKLRGIKKGESFALVTPNNVPMANCCRLLELPQ